MVLVLELAVRPEDLTCGDLIVLTNQSRCRLDAVVAPPWLFADVVRLAVPFAQRAQLRVLGGKTWLYRVTT